MREFFKALSLAPRGIRHKLSVAFALMAVIPMLVCGYLIFYYIFPTVESFRDVSLIFAITIILVLMGFYLAKKIIYPIIEITAHAKGIVEGRLGQELEVRGEDEIGELSGSLNRLSTRLKENMSELYSYGEKIKQINMEINKKVFALSGLLQIGNLITTTTDLDEIFNLIAEKLSQLQAGGRAFLMFLDERTSELSLRTEKNMQAEIIRDIKIKIGQGPLGKVFSSGSPLVIDAQKRPKIVDANLKELLQTKNMVLLPITSSGKIIGILGTGNDREGFLFSDDEIELIGVFTKQVGVAVENNTLMRKTEELSVRDELTGLYNEKFIRTRLDEEIKRAVSYQRPCSLVIFEIDNFEQYHELLGEIAVETVLKKIARTLKENIADIDKAARFSDRQFALLLPEKNKRDCLTLAENIRKEIHTHGLTQDNLKPSISLSGGLSATPIDGTSAAELIDMALGCVEKAKREGQNKIVAS